MKFLFSALFCLAGAAQAAALPSAVAQALKQAGIPTHSVAIEVRRVEGGPALLSLNAERAMNPASTMKLLTTYAALDLLGPAYRWQSEA